MYSTSHVPHPCSIQERFGLRSPHPLLNLKNWWHGSLTSLESCFILNRQPFCPYTHYSWLLLFFSDIILVLHKRARSAPTQYFNGAAGEVGGGRPRESDWVGIYMLLNRSRTLYFHVREWKQYSDRVGTCCVRSIYDRQYCGRFEKSQERILPHLS